MMKIVNIMKVADYNFCDIDPDLVKFMQAFAWYSDTVLEEDLYSPQDALDCDHFAKLPEPAQKQLRTMVIQCAAKDCAYVRFIDQLVRRPLTEAEKIKAGVG
jgi:hypothetical protein